MGVRKYEGRQQTSILCKVDILMTFSRWHIEVPKVELDPTGGQRPLGDLTQAGRFQLLVFDGHLYLSGTLLGVDSRTDT